MQIKLSPTSLTWQESVRNYVDTTLIPQEVEAELNGGKLAADIMREIQTGAIDLGLPGMDAPTAACVRSFVTCSGSRGGS